MQKPLLEKSIRIIGIDDEALVHKALQVVLKERHPDVDYVATANLKQAAEEIKKGAHGVIADFDLSDNAEPTRLQYGGNSGVSAFIYRHQKSTPSLPFLLHTGMNHDNPRIQSILSQGVEFSDKGMDYADAVNRFVEKIKQKMRPLT